MNIRARFEEIWPVPEGVEWGSITGGYFAHYHMAQESAVAHNARLDTFTRCQESTDLYLGIIDEFIVCVEDEWHINHREDLLKRAKQIMEQKK